ncbi:hypothetical protein AAMO2058_001060100 [Amorphochlora amoebiformis]
MTAWVFRPYSLRGGDSGIQGAICPGFVDKEGMEIDDVEEVSHSTLNRIHARRIKAQLMGDDVTEKDIQNQLEAIYALHKHRQGEREKWMVGKSQPLKGRTATDIFKEFNDKFARLQEGAVKVAGKASAVASGAVSNNETVKLGHGQGSGFRDKRGTCFITKTGKRYIENDQDCEAITQYALMGEQALKISREKLKLMEPDDFITQYNNILNQEEEEGGDERSGLNSSRSRSQAQWDHNECSLDPKSPVFRKDLLVSKGPLCFVIPCLQYPLVRNHAWIVAADAHARCTMDVEGDCLEEVRNYKKSILAMNSNKSQRTLFIETAVQLDSNHRRAFIEAVPIPSNLYHKAQIVFKKALLDLGSDWNAVAASGEKVIETNRHKKLHKVLPKGDFPYFHVEFEMDFGLVYIIEDHDAFPVDFGRDVISGLLGLQLAESKLLQRKPSPFDHLQRAQDLKSTFKVYDWVRDLRGLSSGMQGVDKAQWKAAIDPKSNKTYYYNPSTNEVTWTLDRKRDKRRSHTRRDRRSKRDRDRLDRATSTRYGQDGTDQAKLAQISMSEELRALRESMVRRSKASQA